MTLSRLPAPTLFDGRITNQLRNNMSKDVNDKKAWEAAFIKPIAKVMKDRGIAYLLITLRDDGMAAYVMEPMEEECPHNMGHELNGVGMWICLGCRADITPELSPSNDPALAARGLEPAPENHAGDGQPSGLPAAHGSASEKSPN